MCSKKRVGVQFEKLRKIAYSNRNLRLVSLEANNFKIILHSIKLIYQAKVLNF